MWAGGCAIVALATFAWSVPVVVRPVAAQPVVIVEPTTITVTSTLSSGPDSIRFAIEKANLSKVPVRIVFALKSGTRVYVFRQLPSIRGYGTEVVGNGVILKGGDCMRSGDREGCDGLVIVASGVVVRGLASDGFLLDGFSVRGQARDVIIADCKARGNRDDGIGVSEKAQAVTIENCTLEGNGFRTKGKGVSVFDNSDAVLKGNTIKGNRDGVAVTRGSSVLLIANTVAENYDKGVGVTGSRLTGYDNVIIKNGLGKAGQPAPPNADGLRVSYDSTVELVNTTIDGNGDKGVVVSGSSTVVLRGGSISGNGGQGAVVRDSAVLDLRGVAVEKNGDEFLTEGRGRLIRRNTP